MSKVEDTYSTTAVGSTANTNSQPKSKKELRAERKAAKKAATTSLKPKEPNEIKNEQTKEEKLRLKKERRQEQLKERENERRLEKKEKLKREREDQIQSFLKSGWEKPLGKKRQRIDRASKDDEDLAISDSGLRMLEMGVKSFDIVVGKGPMIVQDNSLVTVRYKLTGGKYGVLIDSSKKFTFRVGKGEVVKGWEIGVRGMAVGGMRKLVIPPTAGYGGEDIGAGPGGLLFFDISVLSCC